MANTGFIEDLDLTPPDEYTDLQTWLARNSGIIEDLLAANFYTEIAVSSYDIQETEVGRGKNIFGVSQSGTVNITLPPNLDPKTIIVIRNENEGFNTVNLSVR